MAATGAQAVAVTAMTLGDVMTATGVLGTDGKSGGFGFGGPLLDTPLSPGYQADGYRNGVAYFSAINGGVIDVTQANASNSFTTGFIFAGAPFRPNTIGAIDADITGGVLTFNSLPWGGYYDGASWQFNMPADAYTVHNLIDLGGGDYAYRITFNHVLTADDDPSYMYVGQNAQWVMEGTMTAAVPEASTYGMMLAGLGLVGFAVRRRKLMA